MKRHLFFTIGILVIVTILFGGSAGTIASQTATAPAAATGSSAATVIPTAFATAVSTATAPPDFSVVAAQVMAGPHSTIKSADGKLTLLIPKGALPADVPPSKVKITNIKPETVPVTIDGNAPQLAYQFEPDGLQFSTPAILVLTTDPPTDGSLPILSSLSGEQVEVLHPILYTTDPKSKKLIVTAPVSHFSDIFGSRGDFGISIAPMVDHVQFDPFTVGIEVDRDFLNGLTQEWHLNGDFYSPSPILPAVAADAPAYTDVSVGSFSVVDSFTCFGLSKTAGHFTYDAFITTQVTIVVNGQTTTGVYLFSMVKESSAFNCIGLVTHFKAQFVPAEYATHYTVTALDPDGDPLTYKWSKTNECGDWNPERTANEYIWLHPDSDLPGFCPNEAIHPGDITVVVSDGHGATETVTYSNGSGNGDCVFSNTIRKPKNCTITP